MQYTVLLHSYSNGNYEAVAPAVPGCTGKGNTRDEALAQLGNTCRNCLSGTEITSIDVEFPKSEGDRQNPWLATAGMLADDPMPEPMILRETYSLRYIPEPSEQA
ncbi:MAG: hypothetical protein DRI57_03975 [Deltaproteobacteria bacterium]|nr:MAG: hypothetical protein DRI57_03975 [Deltaproteobacteria bacterium]